MNELNNVVSHVCPFHGGIHFGIKVRFDCKSPLIEPGGPGKGCICWIIIDWNFRSNRHTFSHLNNKTKSISRLLLSNGIFNRKSAQGQSLNNLDIPADCIC